jgi:negative regulator of flagellin synthesis FlgM
MQIRPTNNVQTSHAVNLQTRNTTEKSSGSVPVDQLDISAEAQLLSTQSTGNARADRLADIRAQITSGQYETSEKLDAAVSRMLEEFV